jgi:hypothetical protein
MVEGRRSEVIGERRSRAGRIATKTPIQSSSSTAVLVIGLQKKAGNQAVQRLLGTRSARGAAVRVAPVAVQGLWGAMSLTHKTTMRADRSGQPDPDTKTGRTIPTGTAFEVSDPVVTSGIWTKVRHAGAEGWIRSRKLHAPTTLTERIGEGVLAMKRNGHVPGGADLTPATFRDRIAALPPAEYLATYRRLQGKPLATQTDAGLGFMNPGTGRMYILNTSLADGTVLHEMLHTLSKSDVVKKAGRRMDEGMTEFCRLEMQPSSGPPIHPNYADDYSAIGNLSALGGSGAREAIFDAYFLGNLTKLTTQVNQHVKAKTLAKYKERIGKGTGEAKFDKVRALLGGDPWPASGYDVWCAMGKADFGDIPYNLLEGVNAYESAPLVQAPVTTPAPTPTPATTPAPTSTTVP